MVFLRSVIHRGRFMKNHDKESKRQAILTDWCIVLYPEIYNNTEDPSTVFAKLSFARSVALFGRAKNDPRYNAETGNFTDGHRIVTSPITRVKDNKYYTANTIYTLVEQDKNSEYQKWYEDNHL